MIKFVEDLEKLSIIDKILAASPHESIVKRVLIEKWEI